ncbi:MAG: threonine ammonia-lyase [Methanocalculus sp.]|uniref:threonine ammonia-lyase n=1 Tax=Methanocalculus sp. TaxID=2004547 RepID=UPI002720F281|nr:threonine ammonia-lyase [Methanocalculus sp.]MDO9538532.1 threonine ammonia-lyase [Methanocalculus sp.]
MLSPEDIAAAEDRIRPFTHRTPLVFSPTFSAMTGCSVYLKLETLQKAGSFKIRGATNAILLQRSLIGPDGVVAASAGNHAQGVALAARSAGVRATIVMPVGSSVAKQEATRGYGAEVVLAGRNLQESVRYARMLEDQGLFFIHPYDDEGVIAGAGTIGSEILEEITTPDVVIVPVGGGGLIAGIATAMNGERRNTRIIGVQSGACDAAYRAFTSGVHETVIPKRSIADGIAVPVAGELPLRLIRRYVDEMYTVTEEEMIDAILLLLERKRLVVEGAGATPLALLLSGRISLPQGSVVVLVISGGNIDLPLLQRVIRQAQIRRDRVMTISVVLDDKPGSLADLLQVIAGAGGNILDIAQKREEKDLHPTEVQVEVEVETRGGLHQQRIRGDILSAGYR